MNHVETINEIIKSAEDEKRQELTNYMRRSVLNNLISECTWMLKLAPVQEEVLGMLKKEGIEAEFLTGKGAMRDAHNIFGYRHIGIKKGAVNFICRWNKVSQDGYTGTGVRFLTVQFAYRNRPVCAGSNALTASVVVEKIKEHIAEREEVEEAYQKIEKKREEGDARLTKIRELRESLGVDDLRISKQSRNSDDSFKLEFLVGDVVEEILRALAAYRQNRT